MRESEIRSKRLKDMADKVLIKPPQVAVFKSNTKIREVGRALDNPLAPLAIVQDLSSRVVGLVTNSDLARKASLQQISPVETELKDVMNENFFYITEDATLDDAVRTMNRREVDNLIVVDDVQNMKLAGVLERRKLGRAVEELLSRP